MTRLALAALLLAGAVQAQQVQVFSEGKAVATVDEGNGTRLRAHDERESRMVVFPQGQARLSDAVAERLRQRGVAFSGLRLERGRLDEVFRSITAQGEQA